MVNPTWSYGITTHHTRQSNILKSTVLSLARAGFPSPHLFLDGMDDGWNPPVEGLPSITIRHPNVGQHPNWMFALHHVFLCNPRADFFALFEDDLLACRNLRQYLEHWYPPEGYLNLITHDVNLILTQQKEGWHQSNQKGKGAVGLVFNRDVMHKLIQSNLFYRYATGVGPRSSDGAVITTLSEMGIKEYIHYPTLLQHTGDQSVLGHTYGRMKGWQGEDYDPMKLVDRVTYDFPSLEQKTLNKMIPPSLPRPNVWKGGVIQIHATRACDKACFGCTQGSNLRGTPDHISLEAFRTACKSLQGYWGIVGLFGGNPATHPQFESLCDILLDHFPKQRLGLWSNNPLGKGDIMRRTFNPAVSNLNVHLDRKAYDQFKEQWPECHPFGLEKDSRHSPPFVAMKDVEPDESKRWEMIGNCDINQNWSAMVCHVPNKGLRAFFCEIAGAMAIVHANDPDWPDNGLNLEEWDRDQKWWELPMKDYADQVRWNCHRCGVPLKRYGQEAVNGVYEETSETHLPIYQPKVKDRLVRTITDHRQDRRTRKVTDYMEVQQ